MLEVVRSAAKVCWHLKCNGILVATASSKKECEALRDTYARKYGLTIA